MKDYVDTDAGPAAPGGDGLSDVRLYLVEGDLQYLQALLRQVSEAATDGEDAARALLEGVVDRFGDTALELVDALHAYPGLTLHAYTPRDKGNDADQCLSDPDSGLDSEGDFSEDDRDETRDLWATLASSPGPHLVARRDAVWTVLWSPAAVAQAQAPTPPP